MAAPRLRMSAPTRQVAPEDAAGDVAFMGEPGAFAEDAISQVWHASVERRPQPTFAAVAQAVRDGRATHGILPIENNRAGLVADALAQLMGGDLAVLAQTVVQVRLCLVAPPGATLGGIRRVTSHPMALAQCGHFLAAHPGMAAAPAPSTAGAARAVAARRDRAQAALASRAAADRYGLRVLATDVQDDPANATRFWVIGRPGAGHAPAVAGPVADGRHVLLAGHRARPPEGSRVLAIWRRGGGAGTRSLLESPDSCPPAARPILSSGGATSGLRPLGGYAVYRSNDLPPAVPATIGIRGATTVSADDEGAIAGATLELLDELLARNGIDVGQVISAFFTATPDLTASFPATAARAHGWAAVPMMCGVEMAVRGALPRCIRVLLHVRARDPIGRARHVYLRGAASLRPDLTADSPSVSADDAIPVGAASAWD